MRTAEAAAIASGTAVEVLMDRAGRAAAAAIWSHVGPLPALVLCGPGNNGGDGYVLARELRARGMPVRVAALGPPRSSAAAAARAAWGGPVERLASALREPLLIDALFGTGLARPLADETVDQLARLADGAGIRVAIDLPSGVASDDGAILSPIPTYDLTVTFQTLKPSHRLQPAAARMGRVVVADIGIPVGATGLREIGRPSLPAPTPEDHKYRRGFVAVVAGEMPGAGALCAAAASRAAAGYVRLFASHEQTGIPLAIVQKPGRPFEADPRIGAIVVGPGLGTSEEAKRRLDGLLTSDATLVLDADALNLIARSGHFPGLPEGGARVLTPHAGEFERLFGTLAGSKVEKSREAARRSGAIIILKGADTVVAHPDGRASIAPLASTWLASAGTGDVLAGIVAARCAAGGDLFERACEAVWLHGRAALVAGPALIADDLLVSLPAVIGECR